jgi:hypothetical protein
VFETPTLATSDLYMLMEDAQEAFDSEWDPFPEPTLEFAAAESDDQQRPVQCLRVDLDRLRAKPQAIPPAHRCAQAMCVWFTAHNLSEHQREMQSTLTALLEANPHSTLQVVLEPAGDYRQLEPELVESVLGVCYRHPNYLDRYYSLSPQGLLGSKRVVVLLREEPENDWEEKLQETATIVVDCEEHRLSSSHATVSRNHPG